MKMAKYTDAGDADLDVEDYRAQDGTRVTEEAADAAIKRAVQRGRARSGRPSLTSPGKVSPTVNARVSAAVKRDLGKLADERGVRESVLVREAVEQLLAQRS